MPVSSSAQLTLLPWLLGWEQPADRTTFAAGLHAGSCVGLVVALRHDLASLDRRTAKLVLLTSLPAAVAGITVQDMVERRFGRPGPTAALLAGAGLLLWAADRRPEDGVVGPREAAAAALAQVVALAPGVSRAGATLTVLRAARVRREDAARFAVLMSLPVTAGAALRTSLRARTAPRAVPSVLAGVATLATSVAVDRASRALVPAAALYRAGLAAAVAVRLGRAGGKHGSRSGLSSLPCCSL